MVIICTGGSKLAPLEVRQRQLLSSVLSGLYFILTVFSRRDGK